MKAQGRMALLALVLAAASASAHATSGDSRADIHVWANVDTSLALLKPDGSPLYDDVELSFNPGTGLLMPWEEPVKVFSNDTGKDVAVRLAAKPELLPVVAAPGAERVPLIVMLNGTELRDVDSIFEACKLFDGVAPGASITMPLHIGHGTYKTPGTPPDPISAAGLYEGQVNIILSQRVAAP